MAVTESSPRKEERGGGEGEEEEEEGREGGKNGVITRYESSARSSRLKTYSSSIPRNGIRGRALRRMA